MASVQLLSLPPESPPKQKNGLHRPFAEKYLAFGFFHLPEGKAGCSGVGWGGGEAQASVSVAWGGYGRGSWADFLLFLFQHKLK